MWLWDILVPGTLVPWDLWTLGPLPSSNTSSYILFYLPSYLFLLLSSFGLLSGWSWIIASALVLFWVLRLRLEMDQDPSLTIVPKSGTPQINIEGSWFQKPRGGGVESPPMICRVKHHINPKEYVFYLIMLMQKVLTVFGFDFTKISKES